MMFAERNEDFLIQRVGSAYPPHHTGDHLEEAFIKFWETESNGNRKLIPVHWTSVYNHRVKEGLGPGTPNGALRDKLRSYLSSLDQNDKYFIVCTHDDAPTEELPPNTIVFGAGGNSRKIDVPIPLTCSAHKELHGFIRTIPISFIGSLTHKIRYDVINSMNGRHGVFLNASEWSMDISKDKENLFKEVTQRSIFSLCPRGYGATSYRLYESIQLGSIPVYISDIHLLPWSDEIDWNAFSLIVKPPDVLNLHDKLLTMRNDKIREMQDCLRDTWINNFSIDATCNHIAKRLKNYE